MWSPPNQTPLLRLNSRQSPRQNSRPQSVANQAERVLTRRALLARSFGAGALALLSGCTLALPGTPPAPVGGTATPRSGGTLRIAKVGDIVPAGAPFLLTPANLHFFPLLYDTLVGYDAQFVPQPRLVSNWDWSADARRLTLQLRPNLKFHTGRAFTSADAQFNLEHLRDPAVGSPFRAYLDQMRLSTPDPRTLVIDYESPLKGSFDVLAATFMADSQTLDQTNAGRGFVGTGPFRFKEWLPGDHFTVTRNPDYWQPDKPYLDQVELRVLSDPQTALVGLEAGSVDWVSGVPGLDAQRLQADPSYQVMLTATGGTFYYVGMDVSLPALADRRVRQALNFALNRQRMVDTALAGYARGVSTPWPRQMPGYDAAQDQTYSFDLGKARQLLQAANWAPNTSLTLMLAGSSPLTGAMAEIYQADLATLGVKLDIQRLETVDFFSRLQGASFGSLWMATMAGMNLSPATFLTSAATVRVPNASHFDSPRYRELIAQVVAETDAQRLKAALHEISQILLNESFVAPIAEATVRDAGPEVARANVRNTAWDLFGFFPFQDIWVQR
jgi:peptide/nickel transport system substrate-binding protein